MGARQNLIYGINLLKENTTAQVAAYLKLEYTEVFERVNELLKDTPYVFDSTGDDKDTYQLVIGLQAPEVGDELEGGMNEYMAIAGQMLEFAQQLTPELEVQTLKELNKLKKKVYEILDEEEVFYEEVEDATEIKFIRTTVTWEE